YEEIINDPAYIESELAKGAERARSVATPLLDKVRSAVGIRTYR
ncbi:MAG: tryptophan--tRNA ligase, partial [Gammaproteobacteria bacterium]|nr:tryptophan--tRNA ligase [Gammaproteobacteria bacterium]